jgi:hypothetical protein
MNHLNRYRQQQHIVLMLKEGNEALLMESDRKLLKEMTAVMLPSNNRDRFVAALEGSIDEQLQLSAAEAEEIAEEIECAIIEPEASTTDLADAMARSDAMRGREAQVRLGCVRDALGFSNEDLAKIKADLDQDDDYLAAPPIERIEWYIEAMILHYGSTRYSAAIAQKCLDSVRTEFAVLADEDLALQFKQRLDSKADIPIKQKDTVATHRGVSIE